jgi:hypothetical protein
MADDDLLLGQRIKLLRRPRPLVVDAAGKFQRPACAVDRFDVFDRIIGVKARRPFHLRRTECRSEVIGAEDRVLHAVVPRRDRAQSCLHRIDLADIAAGEHRQCAEAERAAQNPAPVDVVDELAIFGKNALIDRLTRPKQRRSAGANCHRHAPSV